MKCPKCQSSLATAKYEGTEIDRCTKCEGVWLDEGELAAILKSEEVRIPSSIIQTVLSEAKPGVPQAEIESIELCPKCQSELRALNYNYASGVIVDVCPNRHGIWFDRNELEKVQGHFETWEKKKNEEGKKWGEQAKQASEVAHLTHEERVERALENSEGILGSVFHRLRKIASG